ncbi:hypothetical protein CHELA41_40187 [Hyphomicrobiales bacterium]|nr:hypothetical protein CHELA41_40187 [Hyphomicrobiales bacterium]
MSALQVNRTRSYQNVQVLANVNYFGKCENRFAGKLFQERGNRPFENCRILRSGNSRLEPGVMPASSAPPLCPTGGAAQSLSQTLSTRGFATPKLKIRRISEPHLVERCEDMKNHTIGSLFEKG